jgi:hypothetical protein
MVKAVKQTHSEERRPVRTLVTAGSALGAGIRAAVAEQADNELAERLRLYQGAVEVIRGVVERADSDDPAATREGAWRAIRSVLAECERVEREAEQEK